MRWESKNTLFIDMGPGTTPLDIFNTGISRSDFIKAFKKDKDAGSMWDLFDKAKNGGGSTLGNSFSSGSNSSGGFFDTTSLASKFGKMADNLVGGITNTVSDAVNSQMGQDGEVMEPFNEIMELIKRNKYNVIGLGLDTIKLGIGQVLDMYKQESVLLSDINSKTTLTGDLSQNLRDDIEQASIYSVKFGFSIKNLGELYTGLVDKSGKFALINQGTMEKAAPIVRAFGTDMAALSDTISQFEKVGIGASETLDVISQAGVKSMSLGLSGKKVVSDIQTNISKLNEYGFQKGIQGLETMTRKSLEFRMNMDSVFKIADKVMNPEGAIELAANLQVLGGAIGDFNDPIRMMYDATNNVEGLQDALKDAAGSLATYNSEQGRFEITGVNLRKGKAMAEAMGISMEELGKISIATAERTQASSALMMSGLKVDDKEKEFLTNISRMQGGEMKIVVPHSISEQLGGVTEIALDKLTEEQKKVLVANQEKFEKLNPEEVAKGQLTELQQLSRDVTSIVQELKIKGARGGERLFEDIPGLKRGKSVLQNFVNEHKPIPSIYKTGSVLQGPEVSPVKSNVNKQTLMDNEPIEKKTLMDNEPITVNHIISFKSAPIYDNFMAYLLKYDALDIKKDERSFIG